MFNGITKLNKKRRQSYFKYNPFKGIIDKTELLVDNKIHENIIKASIMHSDALIIASDNLSPSLTKFIETSGKPFLPFAPKDKFAELYTNFYKSELL